MTQATADVLSGYERCKVTWFQIAKRSCEDMGLHPSVLAFRVVV